MTHIVHFNIIFLINHLIKKQGTPFYVEKQDRNFYIKHGANYFLCEPNCRNIELTIPITQFLEDYENSIENSYINFIFCPYVSEDGYSYTDGVKNDHIKSNNKTLKDFSIKITNESIQMAYNGGCSISPENSIFIYK